MELARMDRLSICELTTYRWTFEEDVQHYSDAGIHAIGVWRQKLSDFGEEKAVELLKDSGLVVSSLFWAGGFTGSEGRTYKESVDDAKEAVHLAAALGAGCLILYTGARAGHTHNHARRLMKSAIVELAPLAAEHGVVLALEPMHSGCASEWTFLTDLDDALALLNAVNCPQLKLVFDTYHLGQGDAIVSRIPELVPSIGLVQLGDAKQPPEGEQNRCPIGEGNIPLSGIISALNQGGYEGAFEVELMGEEVEAADYAELISRSKRACEQLIGVS